MTTFSMNDLPDLLFGGMFLCRLLYGLFHDDDDDYDAYDNYDDFDDMMRRDMEQLEHDTNPYEHPGMNHTIDKTYFGMDDF